MTTIQSAKCALMALAATTVLAGCSTYSPPPGELRPNRDVQVQVTNHNWMDVTVYALFRGSRKRLGTVTTGTTQRFDLAYYHAAYGDFRLEAQPIASSEVFASQPITVNPGERVVWSVEHHLPLSNLRIASAH